MYSPHLGGHCFIKYISIQLLSTSNIFLIWIKVCFSLLYFRFQTKLIVLTDTSKNKNPRQKNQSGKSQLNSTYVKEIILRHCVQSFEIAWCAKK